MNDNCAAARCIDDITRLQTQKTYEGQSILKSDQIRLYLFRPHQASAADIAIAYLQAFSARASIEDQPQQSMLTSMESLLVCAAAVVLQGMNVLS